MRRNLVIYGLALLLSLIGHTILFEGLGRAARRAPPRETHSLEFSVVAKPPPKPEALPEPPRKLEPKPVDLTKLKELPPPESPPPSNQQEPPPTAKEPVRPVFGVTMSSVVGHGSGSGFSVRVGNTLMKEPEKDVTPPAQVKPGAPVPLTQVTRLPRKIGECEAPPELQRRGIEGKVKLEIVVLENGEVGEVIVKSGLTKEIDDAVVDALKRCRFAPAEVGGQAVATRIPYTYSFYLED